MHDAVIIGGGTAGMTAALYLLRAGKTVLILEKQGFGGQITSSPCVENYPGIASISGSAFADALMEQVLSLGCDIDLAEATGIAETNGERRVTTREGDFPCRAVIIAAGAKHRRLGLPREEELSGQGVSYCAVCDGAFFKGKPVAVVGGGSAALQSAMFLAGVCSHVTVIHRRDTFRGEAKAVEALRAKANVAFCLNARITALLGEKSLSGVTLTTPEGEQALAVEGLFVAVGQEPENSAFAPWAALDEDGYIASGENCLTRAPGVFAAGDCRQKMVRQLTTAAADGSAAALAACRWLDANG